MVDKKDAKSVEHKDTLKSEIFDCSGIQIKSIIKESSCMHKLMIDVRQCSLNVSVN